LEDEYTLISLAPVLIHSMISAINPKTEINKNVEYFV
jgi:hypothetical protein